MRVRHRLLDVGSLVYEARNLAPKRAPASKSMSKLAQRDLRVARVYNVVHAIIASGFARAGATYSGGGIHIGPPRGRVDSIDGDAYDFSFKLKISKADEKLVEQVLSLILGGKRCPFDPNGNEWPDKSSYDRD